MQTSGVSASSSTSSPSATGSSDSYTPGLSAGAAAGIAIGALLAVILIALGTWLLYRRRVKKRRDGGISEPAGEQRPPGEEQKPEVEQAQWRSGEYMPQRSPVEVHNTDFRRYELDDPHRCAELP